MKLEAKDLRIGNLFYPIDRGGKVHLPVNMAFKVLTIGFKVEAIPYNKVPAQVEKWTEFNLQDISPIPLTEEWHDKRFGVKKNGFGNFEYKISDLKIVLFTYDYVYLLDIDSLDGIRSQKDNVCTIWNKDIRKRDMYVHEWQNLYFALSGQELQLNQTT
jgi:hypothetical protein